MNETSGTTMHDSLGRNDGNASHVRFGLPGINGDGYGASGVNSLVTVPSSPTLNPAGQTFSFGLSVRFLTVPKSGYDLLRKGFKAAKGGFFKLEALARQQHQAAQARCLFAGSTGAAKVVDGPNLADGVWHTIVCTKTPRTVNLTVDGQTFTKQGSVGAISNTAR